MKPEIEEFFFSRNLPIDRLIDLGQRRHEVEKRFVQAAIEGLFNDVTGGKLQIARHQIAWEIWDRAKWLKSRDRRDVHLGGRVPPAPMGVPSEVSLTEVIEKMKAAPSPMIKIGKKRGMAGPTVAIVTVVLVIVYTYLGGF